MPTADRRVGVLGGTFDPIHLGHLSSARQVAAAQRLQKVLLVLSARPPHKPRHKPAPLEHRWAMLQLAVRGDPLLAASDVEMQRSGLSYTVATLEALAANETDTDLYLIVGIDAYAEIDTWHRPDRLLALAHVVVTTRPGYVLPPEGVLPPIAARNACCYDSAIACHVHKSGHRLLVQPLDGLDISSSDIRARVSMGLPVAEDTGEAVAAYIRRHSLYAEEVPEP